MGSSSCSFEKIAFLSLTVLASEFLRDPPADRRARWWWASPQLRGGRRGEALLGRSFSKPKGLPASSRSKPLETRGHSNFHAPFLSSLSTRFVLSTYGALLKPCAQVILEHLPLRYASTLWTRNPDPNSLSSLNVRAEPSQHRPTIDTIDTVDHASFSSGGGPQLPRTSSKRKLPGSKNA